MPSALISFPYNFRHKRVPGGYFNVFFDGIGMKFVVIIEWKKFSLVYSVWDVPNCVIQLFYVSMKVK